MSEKPDVGDTVNMAPDDSEAAPIARSYFYLFFVFCGVIVYLQKPVLGLSFVVVLVVGAFAAPLLLAVPLIYLKKVLGAKGLLRPLNEHGKIHHRIIDLAGAVVLWCVTLGAISVLGG